MTYSQKWVAGVFVHTNLATLRMARDRWACELDYRNRCTEKTGSEDVGTDFNRWRLAYVNAEIARLISAGEHA
jgi:hypothetical protein